MAADDPMTEGRRHPLAWLPNALTMARVAIAPVILLQLAWVAADGRSVMFEGTLPAGALLLLAAALDLLDGRLARALRVESAFGRFWDPIADKLVIGAALVGGVAVMPHPTFIIPAALLVGRDALVTWLRTRPKRAASVAQPSGLAKWKTALEYAGLIVLFSSGLLGRLTSDLWREVGLVGLGANLGLVMLWLATALSLWTGWSYWRRARPSARG